MKLVRGIENECALTQKQKQTKALDQESMKAPLHSSAC
jgi:hypothetical protein